MACWQCGVSKNRAQSYKMVRGTSTMMITRVDRAQQGQSVNILRAEEMISQIERERKLMADNYESSVMRKWKWFSVIGYKCKNPIHIATGFCTSRQVRNSECLTGIRRITTIRWHIRVTFNPYPTAFPYGNGMVLHFYQQQESSTTKTVHKVINKGLKAYV